MFKRKPEKKTNSSTDSKAVTSTMPASRGVFSRRLLKKLLPVFGIILFVSFIFAYLITGPNSLEWKNRLGMGGWTAFSVEGDEITNRQYYDLYKAFHSANKDNNQEGNVSKVEILELTRDEIILNRALKAKAKNQGIWVTEADVDVVLADVYEEANGKESYKQSLASTGRTWEYIVLINENNILKDKLEGDLLHGTVISQMAIRYDYHDHGSKDGAEQFVEAAKQKLTSTYGELLEQRASTEDLAMVSDVSVEKENSDELRVAFMDDKELLLTTFDTFPYVAGKTFINYEDVTTEGGEPADSRISQLKEKGDYTEPFKTKSGFVAIFRLESDPSESYKDWNDFLENYKETNDLASRVSSFAVFEGFKTQKAEAAARDCPLGMPTHIMSVTFRFENQFGEPVPGVSLNHDNLGHDCDDSSWGPSNASGQLGMEMNCNYGPHHITIVPPAGYSVDYSASNWASSDLSLVAIHPEDQVSVFHPAINAGDNGRVFGTTTIRLTRDSVTVQGTVYTMNDGSNTLTPLANARVDTCNFGTVTTNGSGSYSFTANAGQAVCLRVSGGRPAGSIGTFVRPFFEGYSNPGGSCPGFGTGASDPNYCTGTSTYEHQVTGSDAGFTNGHDDRSADNGYDFVVLMPAAAFSCSLTLSPSSGTGSSSSPLTSTLSWTTNGAVSGTISPGVGGMTPIESGSRSVSRGSTTTFTATITADDGRTTTCSATLTVTPPVSTAGCPTLSNPHITVSLPDQSPNNNGVPGSTTNKNHNHTQYIRDNKTKVTRTEDVSPDGGTDVNAVPGNGNFDLILVSESYQQAVIDYTIFIDECPYDRNQGSVTYESYYKTRSWTADTYDYSTWHCDYGDELSGTTCWNLRTDYATATCPSGYSRSGSSCYRYEYKTTTGGCTTRGTTGIWCNTIYRSPSCPSGYSRSGFSCSRTVRTTSYPAYETKYYRYTADGAATDATPITNTVNGHLMQPCYHRLAQVDSVQVSGATLSPDREMPTSSGMTARFTVQFDVPPAPSPSKVRSTMRRASSLDNVPFTVQYRTTGGWVDASPSPGSPRTINATSRSTRSSGSQTVTASAGVSAPPLRAGDRVCWRITVGTDTNWRYVNYTGALRTAAPGNNNSEGSFSGSQSSSGCSLPVVNWPYLKILGNDAVAGGTFGCTGPRSANIRGYMRSGMFVGGAAQHALFATDTISGFTSVALRQGLSTSSPLAVPPYGLTFSNSSVPYGGRYQANDGMTCLPDYFASRPDSTTSYGNLIAEMNNGASNLRGTPNANPKVIEYAYFSGNQVINNSARPIPNGFRKVIYVDGTLTIGNNIEYENTSWSNREDVPYVMFVARNINIQPNVTRLDGVYVAQSGSIDTCSGVSDASKFTSCRNELVVNGAMIADRVEFNRTRGTLRIGRQGEGRSGVAPGNSVTECDNGTGSTSGMAGGRTCAAEVISFSPEIYLVLSEVLQPEDNFKLDSFINLAPNL